MQYNYGMRIKSLLIGFFVSLSCFYQASAQICGMSRSPYNPTGLNHSRMHGDDFKAISYDLPFFPDTAYKARYSQFWVKAEVLNVRSGPSLEHEIISETYLGHNVLAFAKAGDWVAISYPRAFGSIKLKPKWVHIGYLSSKPIHERVKIEVLKRKCSFVEYGTYSRKLEGSSERSFKQRVNTYDPCKEVGGYLSALRLRSERHDYEHVYETWRQLQNNPDDYSPPPCYPSK